jgi:hypothetical protein
MGTRRFATATALIVVSAACLFAKDFWENPFDKWSQKDVVKMITDSPWAASSTTASSSLTKTGGQAGENEIFYKITARFFSALPIREAYVRMSRIMNKYDDMNAEQKQQFDARFNKPLTLDFSDRVALVIDYTSTPNDPNFTRDMKNFLDTATAETLKQNVYLITKANGRIDLKEYYPPGKMLPGATFVFPRAVGDKPVVNSGDKDLRFQVGWLPTVEGVYIDFKPQKMVYKGQLSY